MRDCAAAAATFAVVDNVWLGIVARRPQKVTGFAERGASSMRAYINHGLIGATVFLTPVLAAFGALLSRAGGLTTRHQLGRP
ncbi:hypothetical protein [Dactylosporangium sp. CA-139066]|uniref:hypothetical protein n=1 Tax=Dactylosporangium sp. CA-139066 TaxID=3239930 RepID=UPI003D943411